MFVYGKISFEDQLKELRNNRCYFYTGTHPASYTLNFIEAWMTGIPVIAVGPQWGNANYLRNHDLYEVEKLISNGVNGFVSDDIDQLRFYIKHLFARRDVAERVGAAGRQEAIRHFDKQMIMEAWKAFLNQF